MLDKLLQGLVEDWPACANVVYAREWDFRNDEWSRRIGPGKDRSPQIGTFQEGCGNPDYELAYTVEEDVPPPQFGTAGPKARRSTWIPRAAPAGDAWHGDWSDVMGVPWISVLIPPSAADARHFKVDVDEVVAPNRKKVITASVDPVSEESLIPHNGMCRARLPSNRPAASSSHATVRCRCRKGRARREALASVPPLSR